MECPQCRAENREGAHFCRTCGSRLIQSTDQPALATPVAELLVEAATLKEVEAGGQIAASVAELEVRIQEAGPCAPAVAPAPTPLAALEAETGAPDALPMATAAAAPVEPDQTAAPAALPEAAPPAAGAAAVTLPPAQPEAPAGEQAALPAQPELAAGAPTLPAIQPVPPAGEPAPPIAQLAGEPLPPLPPGARVAGRFEIVELLAATAEANIYLVRDLAACPNCGAVGNAPDEPFCIECGIELKTAGAPALRQLREALSSAALGARAEDGIMLGERFYVLTGPEPAPAGPAAPAAAARGLTLAVGYASHVGMVRDLDEDSLCVFTLAGVYESVADPSLGLFIVADGIGGHEGGEVASKMAVQNVAKELIRRLLLRDFLGEFQDRGDAVSNLVRGAIASANKKVYDAAQQRANDMGSTVTLALVMDGAATIANVGDSRTYIHRQGKLRQITTDHSLVASLVTAGVIQPEDIYTHPDRNVIYRSLGTKATLDADLWVEPLAPGDTLLLCCDGLWETVRDDGIEEVLLAYPDPQAACEEMVRRANLAGGEDNISAIVVKVK